MVIRVSKKVSHITFVDKVVEVASYDFSSRLKWCNIHEAIMVGRVACPYGLPVSDCARSNDAPIPLYSHYGTLSFAVLSHSRARNSSLLLRWVSPSQLFEPTSCFFKSLACTFPVPAFSVFKVCGSSDALLMIWNKRC